ncbi:MAG: hypothetical protein HZA89_17110 [Verrucomicrobia bacterium]|nr:hypothetical protein [Verrucomicrobiota bacterium]
MKTAGFLAVILGAGGLLAAGRAAAAGGLGKPEVFESHFARLRVESVGAGLAESIREKIKPLAAEKPLKGVVLDLRFARGDDSTEAAMVAELFLPASKSKDAFTMPVAVLMNRETSGAAEQIAALLREKHVALLLGSRPAGGGLQPDIAEEVSLADERIYFTNAYAEIPAAKSTNTAATVSTNKPVPRLNEAELVRRQREGQARDEDVPLAGPKVEPARPVVRDPVLARALDLLKGLAVAKQARAF